MMKFDMNEAWNTAMRLIGSNRDVVFIVAGVFFFLPNLIVMLMLSDQLAEMQAQIGTGENPQAVMAAFRAFYGAHWWAYLLVGMVQIVGTLGLIALLRDSSRPTVGEALQIGLGGLLAYFGTQILFMMILAVIMIPAGIAIGAGSIAIAVLLGLVAVVASVYLFTKFSLIPPVIAVDGIRNPVKVLQRSWALTKGNSLRIFLFYFLLLLAVMIVGSVISMIVGLVFAMFGATAAMIGSGLVSSGLQAVWAVMFLAVLAAIHRQLGGGSAAEVSEAFE